jgi:DNA modification methylase
MDDMNTRKHETAYAADMFAEGSASTPPPRKKRRDPARRANDLDGAQWTRNSISVWSDIQKSSEEMRLEHPALFPEMLVRRLLASFTRADEAVVLDPFVGTGSTVLAAYKAGKKGIGLDISEEFLAIAQRRLEQIQFGLDEHPETATPPELHRADARRVAEFVKVPVDVAITSPPYWDILNRKRTADAKPVRHYGNLGEDLSLYGRYEDFLSELDRVWAAVYSVLKPGAYLIIVIMDIRKGSRLYPYHADLISRVARIGSPAFIFDDLIIWDRRREYNNLRPLGYPSTFRVNKTHEFILIFRKPLS